MNAKILYGVGLSVLLAGSAPATIIQIDISPVAGAAVNPLNYTMGDHAVGLTAINAVGQPASPATGNEIGLGITFDNVSNLLSWSVGYGSDFGFVDLVGNWSTAHIHGPVAVQFPAPNTGAGVVVGMPHTAGSSARTGSFIGSALLSPTQAGQLLDNLFYINIHSSVAPGGEIRGQLVAVPEPATMGLALIGLAILRRRFRR